MIELPKRIGNISDTDYLQEQIDSMKHQLNGESGGYVTTVHDLEITGEIKMAPNSKISWNNIDGAEDVASAGATQEAIRKVQEMAEQAKSTADSAASAIPTKYVPYSTYIDGRMVISESLAANNLLITGGKINMEGDGCCYFYRNGSDGKEQFSTAIGASGVEVWEKGGGTTFVNGGDITIGYATMDSRGFHYDGYDVALRDELDDYLKVGGAVGDIAGKVIRPTSCYGYLYASYTNASTTQAGIYGSGQLAGYSGSSRKYKTDIRPMGNDLRERIKGLYDVPVKEWRYKDGYLSEEDPLYNADTFGLIAEEVNEVLPEMVYTKDGEVENYRDRHLANALLVLVQEQNERIKALEAKVEALENK